MSHHFPEGIASDSAFLNRESERKLLINRIKANQHTVLIAPRRYGKTSLVIKVAGEIKLAYASVDLLPTYSETHIFDQMLHHIGQLILQLLPPAKKAKETLIHIFQQMKPEISVGAFGQRLTLTPSNKPLQDMTALLLKLDETATTFKKQAVIFMDEFQQISQLKNYPAIEAAIRHAVERSKNIAYVFSGSNRHLLEQMFGDTSRPLYRLCQTISLDRMKTSVYEGYLQERAIEKWGKTLSNESLTEIFSCCQLHPYYMNALCQRVWGNHTLPTAEQVKAYWRDYVDTQRHMMSHDITALSPNQRRTLIGLTHYPTAHVQSHAFSLRLKLSTSSLQQAVTTLMQKDLIYRDDEGIYRILDPAITYYLKNFN